MKTTDTNGVPETLPMSAPQETEAPRVSVPRLTYSREEFAHALGIGTATLDRLEASGKIGPVALKLGGRRLYSRLECEEWLASRSASGELPDRAEWQARRTAKR